MLFKTAKKLIAEMKQWSKEETLRNRARLVVDGGAHIMFFRNKGRLFGANEASRVTFAKFLDRSDEDNDSGWRKHACFTAVDLLDQALGKQTTVLFGKEEIDGVEVVNDPSSVKQELFELMADDVNEQK